MGRTVAAEVAARLIEAGFRPIPPSPSSRTQAAPDKRLFHGTLNDLPALQKRDDLTGPVMVIIGDAVAGANFSKSEPLAVPFHAGQCRAQRRGRTDAMKVLTANRLTDGIAVWLAADQRWSETIADAEIANDADAEAASKRSAKPPMTITRSSTSTSST